VHPTKTPPAANLVGGKGPTCACGVASVRKLRPRFLCPHPAEPDAMALKATFDFGPWEKSRPPATTAGFSEHLPRGVARMDPRHLRQSDACRESRPLSKEVPSRQSRSSAAVYDPKQTPTMNCGRSESVIPKGRNPWRQVFDESSAPTVIRSPHRHEAGRIPEC
jgi:hypothetical protein